MALAATLDFEEVCTMLSYGGDQRLQQHIPPQVLASASGNCPLDGPLRIKPVRTGTPDCMEDGCK